MPKRNMFTKQFHQRVQINSKKNVAKPLEELYRFFEKEIMEVMKIPKDYYQFSRRSAVKFNDDIVEPYE